MNEDIKATFERVVDALNEVQAPYAFIGALAAVEWSRSRSTSDIDLVIAIDDARWIELDRALQKRGLTPSGAFSPAKTDVAPYWSSGSPRVRVDVFIAKLPFEEAVLSTARPATVMGRAVRVASPEAVIVYKLLANRRKDGADLEAIFETRSLSGESLDWTFIDRWCREWELADRLAPWRDQWGPKP
jgi:hypothetical protein